MAHDVFISYAHEDRTVANAVVATLEGHSIRCWIAPRDILPGDDWGSAILDAIKEAHAMVIVFSSHSNNSNQIKREVERAVHQGIAVIPLRIEDVLPSKTLEYFISTQHWLDALTPPLEQHLTHLADTITVLLAKKSGRVETPRLGAEEVGPDRSERRQEMLPPEPQPAIAVSGPLQKFPLTRLLPLVGFLMMLVIAGVLLGTIITPTPPPPVKPVTEEVKPAAEEKICYVFNDKGVLNGPIVPTTFTTTKAYKITYFMTYHANDMKGALEGTVSLRSSDGKTYGPWKVNPTPGLEGKPTGYWIATPNVEIPAGTYTVIDSDHSTWSHNTFSGGRGFTEIRAIAQPQGP
jgi:hypothetical protein